jgi:D-3-phosphoglycerate dehydrogenase
VPAIEATRHLINSETLAGMRPSAKILNFAREEIVDTTALLAALDAGQLGGYVTDFPRPELLGRKDVITMPHIGASTAEAEENCAVMAADQLMDFLEDGNIRNSVNYPKTVMERNGGTRITFSNNNVPKVLGSVLAVLAEGELNVLDMVNKSRGDVAYNIVDVEGEVTEALRAAIAAVDGVTHVRVL